LRSAWRTAETTASAGGHGMRNDDKTHGPGARGAGAVYNWLRRHAGCNELAEVSHIEWSHVRTVVFSGRQRQRSFHDPRRAPSLHSAVGQLFGRLLVVYHRQISRFTAFSEVGEETEGRRATPSPGLLAAGGQNAKVPAVRAAGGALQGRRHACPRQRRRDSRTVNCQHNRESAEPKDAAQDAAERWEKRNKASAEPEQAAEASTAAAEPNAAGVLWPLPRRIPDRCTWTRKSVRTRTSRGG
jgi:hypothetical protein